MGKQLNYGKGYGRWMLAESISTKSTKVTDLLFHDVIDAHLEERTRKTVEIQNREGEDARAERELHAQGNEWNCWLLIRKQTGCFSGFSKDQRLLH
jgi:hypothetical protein